MVSLYSISLISSEGCDFTNSHTYRTRITHKLNRGVGEKKTYQKRRDNLPTKKQKRNNTAGTTTPPLHGGHYIFEDAA
jgi:hypothetical protein